MWSFLIEDQTLCPSATSCHVEGEEGPNPSQELDEKAVLHTHQPVSDDSMPIDLCDGDEEVPQQVPIGRVKERRGSAEPCKQATARLDASKPGETGPVQM